jgi:phosphopantetheine adenylyltransferase
MTKPNLSLLLLPPPPSTLSPANTQAAYGPAIDATLSHVNHTDNVRLDIAITVPPSWHQNRAVSRKAVFEKAQKALSQLYSLICATAAHQRIELDCLGGVDARAFFLLPAQESASELRNRGDSENPFSGPLVSLATLVESQRAYETLFGVESEEGERLLKTFLIFSESKHRHSPTCRRVPGGLSITNLSEASGKTWTSNESHASVAVGGTFDHLHIGHKLLLTATALLAEPKGSERNPSQTVLLTIGISGDDLLTKKKFAEELESWDQRQQKVAEFVESIIAFSAPGTFSRNVEQVSKPGPNGKRVRAMFDSKIAIDYVEILDPFGPTITDESISALVLSQETKSGGRAINEKRQEKSWRLLEIFEVDVLEVNTSDNDQKDSAPGTAAFESKISSTEIRRRIYQNRSAER